MAVFNRRASSLGDDIDGHLARLLAGKLPTHAVGDDEEFERNVIGTNLDRMFAVVDALASNFLVAGRQIKIVFVVLAVVPHGRDDPDSQAFCPGGRVGWIGSARDRDGPPSRPQGQGRRSAGRSARKFATRSN